MTKPKLYFIFAFFFIFVSAIEAQQIKILNAQTQDPVVNVAVYNKDKSKSAITNFDGVVDITPFSANDMLYFKHIAYQLKSVLKSKIDSNTVLLQAKTEGLEEIVISASKFKQDKRDLAQKVSSVNSQAISFTNPQTSADLLKSSGHVFIQKSQLAGGSPIIRGFSTNRLLITVDGVRMNNAIFRGGNLQNVISIDPFAVKNTEVILGASSVIYGSDAIGGVMNFFTKTPQLSHKKEAVISPELAMRYATANHEKTAHLGLNYGSEHWGFLSHASVTHFDDLRMGSRGPDEYLRNEYVSTENGEDSIVKNSTPLIQKESGYNQINLMQKVRYEPHDNLDLDLGLFYTSTSNAPRYDRLIRYKNGNLRSAEWFYGPQKWFMANFNITKLSSKSNLYDKLKLTTAYQNFQESRHDRDFESEFRSVKEEAVHAYSFNLDLEKKLGSSIELFYGLEYVYNKIHSKAREENINTQTEEAIVTRYPNGSSWNSTAAYLSLKYKPNSSFVIQSGLRYNSVRSYANFEENNMFLNLPFSESKNNSGAFTGTAGISWNPNPILQWKFNLSSAFRAPNIDDIGKVFDSEPGSVVVPNENLKPETAYGGELGLILNFDSDFVFEASTYYTYLDNALVRKDGDLNGETEIIYNGELSNVQSIQNASQSRIYGLELAAEVNFSKALKLRSQYNIVKGEEESDGIISPVRHVAPDFGNTHLIWTNKKLKADAFLVYNNELSFNKLAPSEAKKDYIYALDANGNPYSPSWYTLNFRMQYQISKTIQFTASLENISDQRYKTYSSGIAAPGRNLIVSVKYNI